MNRVILFRAKCSGVWRYGYYVHFDKTPTDSLFNERYNDFIITNGEKCAHYYPITDISSIGQYTGLTDKNGNKIFEGDILEYYELETYCINPDCDGHLRGYGSSLRQKDGVVKFHNGEFAVDDGNAYLTGLSICGIYKESLNDLKENAYFEANGYDIDNSIVGKKIIGNVTDNPELME